MLGKAPTPTVVAVLLGFGVVFAMPLAGAFGVGVDAASVPEMKAAGALPAYGQTWVGTWMRTSGWNGFETDMRTMRDNGVTPVVMWYYWGDPISPNGVTYGQGANTKADWDRMAREMAVRANAIMGSRTFLIVLEPEFNKNGISDWETFDGYLENQARIIKAAAPNAKLVVGFGHWGGWDRFDRAVAASSYVGFQILRGSTRDGTSETIAAADQMISTAKTLKARFGKDVVVFDLGIATYGGWEWVQEAALQRVIAKRADMDAAGIRVLVWRYVYDNDYSAGYFGPAESYWGVKHRWGGAKKGYDELVTLLRGGSASTTTTSAATTTTTSTSVPANPFSGVKGNDWWVQADVAASPAKVEVRVNGASWSPMSKASWGSWTRSTYAPYGSIVELKATWTSGIYRTASYRWPDATPVSTSSSTTTTATTTSASGFDAKFSGVQTYEWWVQSSVSANQGLAKVSARVNGGSWIDLTKQSWGGWAKSIHVPDDGKVELRATATTGATDYSGAYYR